MNSSSPPASAAARVSVRVRPAGRWPARRARAGGASDGGSSGPGGPRRCRRCRMRGEPDPESLTRLEGDQPDLLRGAAVPRGPACGRRPGTRRVGSRIPHPGLHPAVVDNRSHGGDRLLDAPTARQGQRFEVREPLRHGRTMHATCSMLPVMMPTTCAGACCSRAGRRPQRRHHPRPVLVGRFPVSRPTAADGRPAERRWVAVVLSRSAGPRAFRSPPAAPGHRSRATPSAPAWCWTSAGIWAGARGGPGRGDGHRAAGRRAGGPAARRRLCTACSSDRIRHRRRAAPSAG